MIRVILLLICLRFMVASQAWTESCHNTARIEGVVTGPDSIGIADAHIHSADGHTTVTDSTGHFVLICLPVGRMMLKIEAAGFADRVTNIRLTANNTLHFTSRLPLLAVETTVEVDESEISSHDGFGTQTLGSKQIAQLADDPDDFQRQLQTLAAQGGGTPGAATIMIDGFQNDSTLPPKDSIASVSINPDAFSSEYEKPPYDGGLIQIRTKPGLDTFHGALFLTDSEGIFNATDPLSLTATPAAKRRYGFQLSGPIGRGKSDFSIAFETRGINEFNVVNAVVLGPNYEPAPLKQTIPTPQRLWIGSIRWEDQVNSVETIAVSFSANASNSANDGTGGLNLAESGYDSNNSDYDLRLNHTQIFNTNLLHETRLSYTWKTTTQRPLSTAPQVQVLGYFTGGGSTSQQLNYKERDFEADDDVLVTKRKHTWKLGVQSLGIFVQDFDPDTFNGAYAFGGGSAPDLSNTNSTITIDGLEQYRRSLLGLLGGNPTTFQLTSGSPLVPLTQWRLALFAQDTFQLTPSLTLSSGLRYAFQTTPYSFGNFAPRFGLSWSINKSGTWILHLHGGLFNNARSQSLALEAYRLNGTRQHQTVTYAPSFNDPLIVPPDSIQVSTIREFPHTLSQSPALQVSLDVQHDFFRYWHAECGWFYADNWGSLRVRNINAPEVSSGSAITSDPLASLRAPRPFALNENIFQYQSSGHFKGNTFSTSIKQKGYRGFSFYAGYLHFSYLTDAGRTPVSPQSSYNDAGESSRPDFHASNEVYAGGDIDLPYKISGSLQFDASSGLPYNITTGADANGDGVFNDRPSYALHGGTGVYSTPFGLLSANSINGNVPRNAGTMPPIMHMDMNLSRSFHLETKKTGSHRVLTLNLRSANLLNHTNVTAVSSVLTSPIFTEPLTAASARRVEVGVRIAF
jgi:hypothetical protein